LLVAPVFFHWVCCCHKFWGVLIFCLQRACRQKTCVKKAYFCIIQ